MAALPIDSVAFGDCLDLMRDIPDASIDAIITDPPYGITLAEWDKCVDFQAWWMEIRRIRKPTAPTVVFCAGKFQYDLYASNPREWRYNWIWEKTLSVGFLNVNKRPLRIHEIISVFAQKNPKYHPQIHPHGRKKRYSIWEKHEDSFLYANRPASRRLTVQNYPTDVLFFPKSHSGKNYDAHPTAKPIDLCEYLIRTYTDENDIVLDPFCGGGAVPVSAARTGRHFIGIEKDPDWHAFVEQRVKKEQNQTRINWW